MSFISTLLSVKEMQSWRRFNRLASRQLLHLLFGPVNYLVTPQKKLVQYQALVCKEHVTKNTRARQQTNVRK